MSNPVIQPVEFVSENETIRGNLLTPTYQGPFYGICKFHGLPGSPDQTSGIATRLAKAGFAVLTFDFRGFRKSDGLFSLGGMIHDASAAVSFMLESDLVYDDWIGAYGASFGGAVAVCTAARDKRIKAVCLRAPVFDTSLFVADNTVDSVFEFILNEAPDSVHDITNRATRQRMKEQLIIDSQTYNPMIDIRMISPRPILIITGNSDDLIPLGGVKRLYETAGNPKDIVIVEGADHVLSDAFAKQITEQSIVEWFLRTSGLRSIK